MASSVRLGSDSGMKHAAVLLHCCGRSLLCSTQKLRPSAPVLGKMCRPASSSRKKLLAIAAAGPNTGGKTRLPIASALDAVKKNSRAKFDETVELAIMLNVDPRKSNQNVRGTVQLPKGTGKTVRVAVFAKGDDVEKATAAGADIVGGEDLLQSVLDGKIDFDKCVATPEMMPIVGRAGRVLGPRGLMPNAKVGSVTRDVEGAIKLAKAGQANIRAGKNGVMHLGIGKVSFDMADLLENVRATMVTISNLKPEVIKGSYIKQVHLTSTMGKGVAVDIATVDPSHSRFMLVDPKDVSALMANSASKSEGEGDTLATPQSTGSDGPEAGGGDGAGEEGVKASL